MENFVKKGNSANFATRSWKIYSFNMMSIKAPKDGKERLFMFARVELDQIPTHSDMIVLSLQVSSSFNDTHAAKWNITYGSYVSQWSPGYSARDSAQGPIKAMLNAKISEEPHG